MRTIRSVTILTAIAFFVGNSSSNAQTKPSQSPSPSNPEAIREVDFCDIVKQPRRFFDRAVRIKAQWQQGEEFSYLIDERCPASVSAEIAVRYTGKRDQLTMTNIAKLSAHEYGGRAMITAVGTLRNPGKYYGYFRYWFEIDQLEEVAHVITTYDGNLDAGKTYRAVVRGDKEYGLLLVPPFRNPFHYAARIEWLNLSDFPKLDKLHENAGESTIVFSVMSDERKQIDVRRWNRTLECKIIRTE
jgi:hypothetical protein